MPAAKKSAHTQQTLSLACAECKRLKLKCSKTVPCEACTRRGCESICPDGQLRSGRGTRFILSNTKELHDQIDTLNTRIRDLEKALADVQSQVSDAPHPLLKESLALLSKDSELSKEKPGVDDEEVLIDTFGSLTLKPDGSSEWHGRHGGSEFFIQVEEKPQLSSESALPASIDFISKMLPFKTVTESEEVLRQQVRSHLPAKHDAWETAHQFYAHIAWSASPVQWTSFLDEVLTPVYTDTSTATDTQVAVLFLVLSLGIALDLKRKPYDPIAAQYMQLGRTSLMLGEDLLTSRSTAAILALQLMAFYYQLSNDPQGPSRSWMLTAMAIRIAQSAGFHRDSDRWDKYPEEAEKRRRIWWELVSFETMQGFALGRPPAVITSQCDTKMPKDDTQGPAPSFNRMKYAWINDCLGPVLNEAFSPKPPPYRTVLQLDRKLRDYPLPDVPSTEDVPVTTGMRIIVMLMRSFTTVGLREISLLYLHRMYMVEALTRWPEDPLRSKFALSILAVHRSALLILQGISRLNDQLNSLASRLFFIWLHGLSAYVCLSAIVIRSPGCALAHSSLAEIDRAKNMFDGISAYRLAKATTVLAKLREQAHLAYAQFQAGTWTAHKATSSSTNPGTFDLSDEEERVLRLAGASGIVAREDNLKSPTTTSSPGGSNSTNTASQTPENVHPTLFEYLKVFQGFEGFNGAAPNGGVNSGMGGMGGLNMNCGNASGIPGLAPGCADLFTPRSPVPMFPTLTGSGAPSTSASFPGFSPNASIASSTGPSTSPNTQGSPLQPLQSQQPQQGQFNIDPTSIKFQGGGGALFQMDMRSVLQPQPPQPAFDVNMMNMLNGGSTAPINGGANGARGTGTTSQDGQAGSSSLFQLNPASDLLFTQPEQNSEWVDFLNNWPS